MKARPKALLSWSSGKDSAWALRALRAAAEVEVVGLITTLNQTAGRVAMHAVREALLEAQAEAAGLPLTKVYIPSPCTNAQYEAAFGAAIERAVEDGVEVMAFGDLYLEDVRQYRVDMLAGTGLRPVFPLWGEPTAALAKEMIAGGLSAIITCVDPKRLDPSFVGRDFDADFLAALPSDVDPCGEGGEFHSFVHTGPMFSHSIPVEVGVKIQRDGFWFADILQSARLRRPDD